jgi:CRP-like cAMP-binding protein
MVGGLILISLLIGEMNVYLMGIMQGSAAFQRKIDRVNHEMEYYAIPIDLQRQVRAFYDYVWIHQKQFDDKIALLSDENMSTDLQRKLALHMYKDVVSHISIFSGIDDLVLGEICLSLRTRIFLPRDMIICKGDIGKELFIIAKGVVEVLRDDLPPDKRLHAPPIMLQSGSFFGEIALIMEVRRTCSVQARTICEVNLLDQKAFDSILRDNPEFARRMNELVVVRQLERTMTRWQIHHPRFDVGS